MPLKWQDVLTPLHNVTSQKTKILNVAHAWKLYWVHLWSDLNNAVDNSKNMLLEFQEASTKYFLSEWHVHPLAVYYLLYVGIPELYSVLKLNLEEFDVSSRLKAPGFLFRNLSIHSLSCCKDSLRNWSLSESSCSMNPLEPPRRTLTNIKICKSIKIPLWGTCFMLGAYFAREWGMNASVNLKLIPARAQLLAELPLLQRFWVRYWIQKGTMVLQFGIWDWG